MLEPVGVRDRVIERSVRPTFEGETAPKKGAPGWCQVALRFVSRRACPAAEQTGITAGQARRLTHTRRAC